MKIGVMSDTHGSLTYFDKALKVLSDCDILFHIGDVLYHGPRNDLPEGYNPKPVIEKINKLKNIVIVKGNCESDVDQMVIKHPIQSPYAVCQIDKTRFILNHGYTESKDEIMEKAKNMGADVLILGHTHIKESTFQSDLIVLNPGSTSIPKDGTHSVSIIELSEKDNHKNKLDIKFIDLNSYEEIKID